MKKAPVIFTAAGSNRLWACPHEVSTDQGMCAMDSELGGGELTRCVVVGHLDEQPDYL